jgi:uncharacterized protein involved in exopolysaccharide biosynthesis
VDSSSCNEGIEPLQKASRNTARPKRSADQARQRTHIVCMKAIVPDQSEQETLPQISTIPTEQKSKTSSCNG